MKKRKKSKLLLLLLTMTLTIALLGTTSYAWFTENRNVSVAPIQVNIAATGGIQVSENAINWRSLVDNSLLLGPTNVGPTGYATSANQIPGVLTPVSSGLETAGARMNMYSGSVVSDGGTGYNLVTVKSNEAVGTNGAFIAFDLFFRYEGGAPGNIYLTTTSGVIASGADSGIKNAARIAFIPLGNTPISSATPAATIQSYATAGPVVLWEPNYDSHTANAILHASSTYGITASDGDSVLVPYSGVIDATTVPVAEATETDNEDEFLDIPQTRLHTKAVIPARFVAFNLTPAAITKMRVYMWVEGQDIDCENAASGATITFNLQFSLDAA